MVSIFVNRERMVWESVAAGHMLHRLGCARRKCGPKESMTNYGKLF